MWNVNLSGGELEHVERIGIPKHHYGLALECKLA